MPRSWSLASSRKDGGSLPSSRTRDPIGISQLLEVYDDYPKVVNTLETTTLKLDKAEEAAQLAEEKQSEAERLLVAEKSGREADGVTAKQDKEAAEKAVEKRIRGELEPQIKDLKTKLEVMTKDRDKLQEDLKAKRVQMEGWVTQLEKFHKERTDGIEKERKATEDRAVLGAKLESLDKEIMEGLRLASKPPQVEKAASLKSTRTTGTVAKTGTKV